MEFIFFLLKFGHGSSKVGNFWEREGICVRGLRVDNCEEIGGW